MLNSTRGEEYIVETYLEAMRLYPPAFVVFRAVRAEGGVDVAGYTLPRGTFTMLSPYLLHRWVGGGGAS